MTRPAYTPDRRALAGEVDDHDRPPPLPPKALSIAAAAEAISVSPTTIRRLIRSGELRSIRLGDRVLIRPDALDALLDAAEAS